ncbi:MAG: radical SAM protein [Candidatus Eremiobacteraeota bacterium]|nr:radical SAM protein [Candidatus Eremiobacteraeota bacterium]
MNKFPYNPKVVGWELTLACNMNCIHCGSSAGSPRENELDIEEGLSLIDQLIELGVKVVTLSGGEPLIHPGWEKYAKKISSAGIDVYMISNGLLLKKYAKKIKSAGINRMGISLDGMEDTHNFIRNNPKSFQIAMEGIKEAINEGLTLGAVTHISKANFSEMEDMYDLFNEIGLKFWQIQITFSMGRMKEHKDYSLNPEQLPKVAEFIHNKQKQKDKISVIPGDNVGYYGALSIRDKTWKGCFAGRHLLGIDSDGAVKGCLSLPREFIEGNIREEPLRKIWEDVNRFKYNRYFSLEDLEGFCKDCPKGDPCRAGCVVTAYSSTGNRFNNPYCIYRIENKKKEN